MGQIEHMGAGAPDIHFAIFCTVGRLVCSWGMLEKALEEKIASFRDGSGDTRLLTTRNRPNMARLLAELRAMISMRDRRNAMALTEIAAAERDIQRVDRIRGLVVAGFHGQAGEGFALRDSKNVEMQMTLGQLEQEIERLEDVGHRLLQL